MVKVANVNKDMSEISDKFVLKLYYLNAGEIKDIMLKEGYVNVWMGLKNWVGIV